MHNVNANGASIPAIGFGTWTLDEETAETMVREALAAGYRHIDTAAMYRNEAGVGRALADSGLQRDDVFLTTKVWRTDIAPGDLERSAEASLKKLAVDQVDLLLIHWPNRDIPLEGSIKALNAVREKGMTRHIGVSNFPTDLLAQAIGFSDAPLVADQVENHPYLDQTKVHDACRKAGMAMVSYSPLYRGGEVLGEKAVKDAAARHGKTPGQVVLRWHVQQEGVVAIPRTTRKERVAENIDVFDFALDNDEMAAISALRAKNSRLADGDFAPKWDVL